MEGGNISLLVALGAGLLSFLSPCVLPLFPSYLSFIAGVSFQDLEAGLSNPRVKRAVLASSIAFILGFSFIFVVLGASFSLLGQLLYQKQWLIRRVGGILIVLFGLFVAGFLKPPFLMREWRFHLQDRPAGYMASFLIGVTFASGWTPCIGPVLGSILLYASTLERAGTGVLMLATYSMGLAIPFFMSAVAFRAFLGFFERFKKYIPLVNLVSGLFLVLVGALIFTDYLPFLSAYLVNLTPEWLWKNL